jgi:hypothetical protein
MWVEILVGVIVSVNLGLWAWTALKVIDQGRQLVELQAKVMGRDVACEQHTVWSRSIDARLSTVAEGVSYIRGRMENKVP